MEDPRNKKINNQRWLIDKQRLHLSYKPLPKRDPKKIDEIIDSILTNLDQPKQDFVIILENNWNSLVGDQIAQFSKPAYMKNNYLFINVFHYGWINELEKIKPFLLNKINNSYDSVELKGIRFLLNE